MSKTTPIYLKIDKKFSFNFDILQNIKVWNRKSSQWFSDEDRLMISMRDWTTRLWNEQTGGIWTSWLYFFSDFLSKRHIIKWYNNRVWRLNTDNEWTDLWVNFWWNNFNFNTVRIPLNLDWSTPTEYTTPTNATWSEFVKKAAWDTWWISNIWKILLITDNTWDNQVYRWCFWTILGYDSTTEEYILWDSWIFGSLNTKEEIVWLKSGSKYRIYDTIWEHLQVSNWVSLDRYFFGKSDWTLEENTTVQWFATYWLRNIQAITSTQFLTKQLYYSNSYFFFNKWTLFYTSWNVNSPFFYTYTNVITIPWIKWGFINDIFVFKRRLVIAWNNFIWYIPQMSDLIQVELITNSYWMKEWSLIDVWVDAYFLSTDKEIYSLSETITWALLATNIWTKVNNYLKDYNVKITAWFSWKQLFYYWQKDNDTEWIILVLDIQYKFWSIYTWLRPSSIVSEWWVVYLTDNNSDIVRFFDSTTTKDVWNIDIEQKIWFNEIYLEDVFFGKRISDLYLWLDNYTQDLDIDIYMANIEQNWRKQRKNISIQEVDVEAENIPMWEWNLWENILWWVWYEKNISYPFMKHIALDADSANIWKIIITWKDWSPFYLNEFMYEVAYTNPEQPRQYFSATHTI